MHRCLLNLRTISHAPNPERDRCPKVFCKNMFWKNMQAPQENIYGEVSFLTRLKVYNFIKTRPFQRHLLCGTQVKQTAASVSYASTYGYVKHSRSVSNVILKIFKKIYFHFISLTLKELRGFDPSPVVFPKMCFIERLQNPVFLWLFL